MWVCQVLPSASTVGRFPTVWWYCVWLSPSLQSIRDSFSSLKELSDDRKDRIQNGIAAQQKLDNLRLEFAKRAAVSDYSEPFQLSCANFLCGHRSPPSLVEIQQLDGQHPG